MALAEVLPLLQAREDDVPVLSLLDGTGVVAVASTVFGEGTVALETLLFD